MVTDDDDNADYVIMMMIWQREMVMLIIMIDMIAMMIRSATFSQLPAFCLLHLTYKIYNIIGQL